jgi:hypothetical protein
MGMCEHKNERCEFSSHHMHTRWACVPRAALRHAAVACCQRTPGEKLQQLFDAPLIDPLTDSMDEPEALRW